jgi:hypothetical protein
MTRNIFCQYHEVDSHCSVYITVSVLLFDGQHLHFICNNCVQLSLRLQY